MRILKLALALSLVLNVAILPKNDACGQAPDSDEYTVGTISLSPPEEYIIAEDLKTKKKRIYKKDTYEKLKNKDLKFLQVVLLDSIEYRYKPVPRKVLFAPEEFELMEIKDKKAILKRDYWKTPEVPLPPLEEPIEVAEEVSEEVEEELIEGVPSAKRLVAELFYKIETSEISENEWEVKLPTLLAAAANFGEALFIVVKKIEDVLEPEKKTKIYFKTSIGKGIISPDGLLIESLDSSLKNKCGMKDDDLIKAVNGKSLTGIQDVAALFSTFARADQTVTIKLTRGEEELTLTYYIK